MSEKNSVRVRWVIDIAGNKSEKLVNQLKNYPCVVRKISPCVSKVATQGHIMSNIFLL